MIEILQAGTLTSVQDLGRPGLRHLGIAQCGALDPLALTVGNRLVGNDPTAAGLEIHAGAAVRIRFLHDTEMVLTGAEVHAELDNVLLWPGWRIAVRQGQTLTLAKPRHGARAYLALAGGIDVEPILASRSTDLYARFGGWQGRALEAGTQLPSGTPNPAPPVAGIRLPVGGHYVRAIPGPNYAEFAEAARQNFWRRSWTIHHNSNRMGYRLQGPPLTRSNNTELASHAVWPGTVQVPANGQPVVLLADAQTTGGYPRIACVIEADLWKLAQLPLAARMRFIKCTPAEAASAWQRLQQYQRCIARVTGAN